jgi:hypothetical protein
MSGIGAAGGTAIPDPASELLSVNDEFTVSVVIARCFEVPSGALRWRIRLDAGLAPDMTIAVRMNETNEAPLDYYVLPSIDMTLPRWRLGLQNGLSFDAYRFESLDFFYVLTGRAHLSEAA